MTDKPKLLKVKAHLKKRQPKFFRQGSHKHKRVARVWRAPKGLHSKMKDSKKGHRAKLQGGYQTPVAVRGLDKHGLKPTIVATPTEMAKLDPKVNSIILVGGLGGRKKLVILEEAQKKKFTVLNAKADAADKIKSSLSTRKELKKAKEATKSEKKKTLEQKAKDVAAKKNEDEPEAKTDAEKKKEQGDGYEHKKHDHKEKKDESKTDEKRKDEN
jgi:large subunit ribosomal protein L32e